MTSVTSDILAICKNCSSIMHKNGTQTIADDNCTHDFVIQAQTQPQPKSEEIPPEERHFRFKESFEFERVNAVRDKTIAYKRQFNIDNQMLLQNFEATKKSINAEIQILKTGLETRRKVLLAEAQKIYNARKEVINRTLTQLSNHSKEYEKVRSQMLSTLNKRWDKLDKREESNVKLANEFISSTPTIYLIPLTIKFDSIGKDLCLQEFNSFGKIECDELELNTPIRDYGPEGAVQVINQKMVSYQSEVLSNSGSIENSYQRQQMQERIQPTIQQKIIPVTFVYDSRSTTLNFVEDELNLHEVRNRASRMLGFSVESVNTTIANKVTNEILNPHLNDSKEFLKLDFKTIQILFNPKSSVYFKTFKLFGIRKGENNSSIIIKYRIKPFEGKGSKQQQHSLKIPDEVLVLVECMDENNIKLHSEEFQANAYTIGSLHKYQLEVKSSRLEGHMVRVRVRLQHGRELNDWHTSDQINMGYGMNSNSNSVNNIINSEGLLNNNQILNNNSPIKPHPYSVESQEPKSDFSGIPQWKCLNAGKFTIKTGVYQQEVSKKKRTNWKPFETIDWSGIQSTVFKKGFGPNSTVTSGTIYVFEGPNKGKIIRTKNDLGFLGANDILAVRP